MVPVKSSGPSLFERTRRMTSSYAAQNPAKSSRLAPLMLGTRSVRLPSSRRTSTARPRFTTSFRITYGSPSIEAKAAFIAGTASTACTTAHPIRWVKLTLPPRPPARKRLITRRFSSSSLAGTIRNEVAVGRSRLACMFFTMRSRPNRSRSAPGGGVKVRAPVAGEPPSRSLGGFAALSVRSPMARCSGGIVASAAFVGASTPVDPSPASSAGRKSSKNSFQASLTAPGSSR